MSRQPANQTVNQTDGRLRLSPLQIYRSIQCSVYFLLNNPQKLYTWLEKFQATAFGIRPLKRVFCLTVICDCKKYIYTYIDRYIKKITGKNINLNLFQLEQKIRERKKH